MSGEESATAKPPPSEAERRKARWKALIQEHIAVAERAMAERADEQERGALADVVAAGLRRREEELDAEQDAEAWAAAHPPKKMPEAKVEYFRRRRDEAREWDVADVAAVAQYLPAEMGAGLHRNLVEWSQESREHAAGIVREYEANGYVEHFEPDDFGLPPKFLNLLCGIPARPSASSLSSSL
ncbi:unnamed protein product [Urochloa decumbens]|uniref:Uncharacterized protein n=1 Tax=Urochloa decumbens TaxID=240449 RepID=A0ABC9GPD5_9POAL